VVILIEKKEQFVKGETAVHTAARNSICFQLDHLRLDSLTFCFVLCSMSAKRARNDKKGSELRLEHVMDGVPSVVHDELRRMCVSRFAIQTSGWSCFVTAGDINTWYTDGPAGTPRVIDGYCDRQLLWTGLERTDMVFCRADKNIMSGIISAMMQGCHFCGDVDLSINRGEARMLGGLKTITSVLAFVRGDCNMKFNNAITCRDGIVVDEISYEMLPIDEKRHFLGLEVPFFLFDRLTVENEAMIRNANWDGFGG